MVNPYLYIIFNQRYGYNKPEDNNLEYNKNNGLNYNNNSIDYNKKSTNTRCVTLCVFKSIYMGWNDKEIKDCVEKCKRNKNK